MSKDYDRKAKNYELFIRKVYRCEKGKKYGADEQLMLKLFLYEMGTLESNQRIPIKRQYFKVKLYVEKALIKLKKRKKYVNSYEHFTPLLSKLDDATTVDDLSRIVNASLAKMIELENELRRSLVLK